MFKPIITTFVLLAALTMCGAANAQGNAWDDPDRQLAIKCLTAIPEAKANIKIGQNDWKGLIKAVDDKLARGGAKERDLYDLRANLRIRLHDYKGAIEDFSKALEYDPDFAPAIELRRWCYMQTGQESQANLDESALRKIAPDWDNEQDKNLGSQIWSFLGKIVLFGLIGAAVCGGIFMMSARNKPV